MWTLGFQRVNKVSQWDEKISLIFFARIDVDLKIYLLYLQPDLKTDYDYDQAYLSAFE